MNDRELEIMLGLVADVDRTFNRGAGEAVATIEALTCPTLASWVDASARDETISVELQAHLASCARCAGRVAAIRSSAAAPLFGAAARRPARFALVARRAAPIAGVSIAAAAALLLAFFFGMSTSDEAPLVAKIAPIAPGDAKPHGLTLPSSDCEIDICVEMLPVAGVEQRRVLFEVTAEADCVALAVIRAWNEQCQCLDWSVHDWSDGRSVEKIQSSLDRGVPHKIEVDLASRPGLNQTLVVFTAQDPLDLPTSAHAAATLFDCMSENAAVGKEKDPASSCVSDTVCIARQDIVVR